MDDFNEYLLTIDNKEHLEKIANVLKWIHKEFPQLKPRIAWNQPMYTDHGTFIIGFSVAKNHFSVSAEKANEKFKNEIKKSGYESGKKLFRIPFDSDVNYELLKMLIEWNINNKKNIDTFWWK